MSDIDNRSCPVCGYTERDAQMQMDHNLCTNSGHAPWEQQAQAKRIDDGVKQATKNSPGQYYCPSCHVMHKEREFTGKPECVGPQDRIAELESDLAVARREIERLKARLKPRMDYVDGIPSGYGEDEIDRLREGLRRFGRHEDMCRAVIHAEHGLYPKEEICDCGWREMAALLEDGK